MEVRGPEQKQKDLLLTGKGDFILSKAGKKYVWLPLRGKKLWREERIFPNEFFYLLNSALSKAIS